MKELKKAFLYLRGFIWDSIAVIVINISSCIFEGVSIGMLIPLLQSMMSQSNYIFAGFSFLNRFQHFFSQWNYKQVLSFLVLFVFVTIFLKNIFSYAGTIKSVKIRYLSVKKFKENLLNAVLGCSNKYYDSVKMGHIVNGINYETSRMGDFIYSSLSFIATGIKIIIYMAILGLVSWKLSLLVLVFFILTLPVIQGVIKKIKYVGEISSAVSSKFNFMLLEILNGIRVIKSFGTEEYEIKRFEKANNDFVNSGYRYEKYNQLIPPLSETVVLGLLVILFLVVVKFINIDIAKMIPYILVYILVLNRTMVQTNTLNHLKGRLIGEMAAFNTYEKILKDTREMSIPSGDKKLSALKEGIGFKDVSFSYIDDRSVLKNININIPVGKITAIVGATGAGKTTLINLIPRFYEVSAGTIFVDSIPLAELDIHNWRRKVGIVSQDIFIFNAQIKENISYGSFNLSEEEIIKAAKLANVHEFIEKLPDGYNTIVGDRGVKLSGGQKQRISIARAIIHDPEVLILDEATSSLDTETEKLIQEAIERLTYKKTVIAIAHRLSTIKNADNIVVLENGEVIEEGRHEDLMIRNGHYKKYYDLQYGNI